MSQYKYAEIADTVYFWFAANDTTGTAGDGATPLYDVRLAGAASDAAPTASGTPTLLSHANYSAGLHEIAIDTTGYAAGEYAVFCTLTISAVNPAGFCGSFKLRTAGTAALKVDPVGAVTLTSLSVTGQMDVGNLLVDSTVVVGTTTTLTGNVSCGAAFDVVGALSANSLLIDTTTALTGAVTAPAGIAANITGNIIGTLSTCTTNTDMRGTDNAALASVLGAAVGADISADIAAVKAQTVAIEADTDVIDDATSGLVKIASDVAAVLVDTGTTIPGTITTAQADLDIITGATGVNLLAATQASIDAIEADTNELQADDTPAAIAALDAVVDTVKVDTAAIKVITDALTAAAAAKLAASADTIITGTVAAGTLSTTQATTDIVFTDASQLNGRIIIFRSATTTSGLRHQATDITEATVAGGLLTFTAITRAPVAGDTFVIV